jgi:predicted nucleic acid-binding protein
VRVFVDTNVLIYAKDRTDRTKQTAATRWLGALAAQNAVVVSRQSLREYYNTVTKPKLGIPRETARREVAALHAWLAPDGGFDRLQEAWEIQDRFKFSFYDCMLLAAARAAKCSHFLSEDLHHGTDVDGTVVTGFIRFAPEQVLKV